MSQRSSLLTSWKTSVVVCKSSRECSEAFETSRLRYVGVDDKQATVSAPPPSLFHRHPPPPNSTRPRHPLLRVPLSKGWLPHPSASCSSHSVFLPSTQSSALPVSHQSLNQPPTTTATTPPRSTPNSFISPSEAAPLALNI